MKRYQECNKIQKIWRHRWKLIIPFVAVYYYAARKKVYMDINTDKGLIHTKHFEYMSMKLCWRIAQGDASSKMNHYYTHEEVMQRFENKFNTEDENI